MVDEDLADTILQDGTRNHGVAAEREHKVDDGILTEWPALDGVGYPESVDELHVLQLSRTNRCRDKKKAAC